MPPPLLIPLLLGTALMIVGIVTDGSVELAGLLAAFGLGVAFPESALVSGGLVIVPPVVAAVAVGASESIGLAALAVAAGAAAVVFSALLGAAGALFRQVLGSARR